MKLLLFYVFAYNMGKNGSVTEQSNLVLTADSERVPVALRWTALHVLTWLSISLAVFRMPLYLQSSQRSR